MTKLVNIYPNGPITTINPPIRIRLNRISMDITDIRKCLIAKAYVEEILDGNKTIPLTFENYDKDNDDAKDVKEEPKMVPVNHDSKDFKPEPKTETPDLNKVIKLYDTVAPVDEIIKNDSTDEVNKEEDSNEEKKEEATNPVESNVIIEDSNEQISEPSQESDEQEDTMNSVELNVEDTESADSNEEKKEDNVNSEDSNEQKEVASNKNNNKKNNKKGKVTYQKLN